MQFEYNDFNQVTKDYQAHGGAVNTSTSPKVQYGYESGSDNNIRQTSMTYPDGRVFNYDYGTGEGDQLSRVLKLKIGTTEIVDYSYLGLSQVVIQKYMEPSTPVEYNLATGTGNDPYDGLDRFGRIVELLWQKGSTKLVDYEYGYDRVGNRKWLDVKNSPVIKHTDELYDYDGLYRLSDYDRGQLVSGSISSPDLTQEWTLDQTGNWTNFQQGVTGILNQNRTQNTTNEITNITKTVGVDWPTPAHDDNGNMTSFPQPSSLTNSYDATWDTWNRLVKLNIGDDTAAEYEYDGLGRRIIKKDYKEGSLEETRHFYFSTSSQVLEERVDTDTDPTQQFLWGIRFVDDLVLRDRDTTGNGTLNERLYGLSDPRFSVVAITDSTGVVKERYAYDGYGHSDVFAPDFRSRASSSFAWEYRYTGRRLDLETAIYYFRARYYHAELGRFVSRDPIGYVGGMNLYAAYFVPNQVDPSGNDVATPLGAKACQELTQEAIKRGLVVVSRYPSGPQCCLAFGVGFCVGYGIEKICIEPCIDIYYPLDLPRPRPRDCREKRSCSERHPGWPRCNSSHSSPDPVASGFLYDECGPNWSVIKCVRVGATPSACPNPSGPNGQLGDQYHCTVKEIGGTAADTSIYRISVGCCSCCSRKRDQASKDCKRPHWSSRSNGNRPPRCVRALRPSAGIG